MADLGPWASSQGASKIPLGVPGPAKEERWGGLKGRENPTNQEGPSRVLPALTVNGILKRQADSFAYKLFTQSVNVPHEKGVLHPRWVTGR